MMKPGLRIVFVILVAAVLANYSKAANSSASALNLAQELEQAIYLEETVGDLAEAAKRYKSLIDKNNATRNYLAEARLRLAQCYIKMGDKQSAQPHLKSILQDFKDIEVFASQARQILDKQFSYKRSLVPVPWKDGEVLEYQIMGNGTDPKSHWLFTKKQLASKSEDGLHLWESELIINDVENRTQLLAKYVSDGEMVRKYRIHGPQWPGVRAEYKDGYLNIHHSLENKNSKLEFQADSVNEFMLNDFFRRLPYSKNYETRFKFFSPKMMTFSNISLKVVGEESIEVPAGKFEAYKIHMETSTDGAFLWDGHVWVDKSDRRLLVKNQVYGAEIILASIDKKIDQVRTYRDEKHAFKIDLPPNWLSNKTQGSVFFNAELLTIYNGGDSLINSFFQVRENRDLDCSNIDMNMVAGWNIDWAKNYFPSFELREGKKELFEFKGYKAIHYVADLKSNGADLVDYWVAFASEPYIYQINFQMLKDKFEKMEPEIKKFLDGVDIQKPK